MGNKKMNRFKVVGVAIVVTAATVGMGLSRADSASVVGNGPPEGTYTTSDASMSQSMVKGSSPTSLGDSPLAKTTAGKMVAAGVTAEDEQPGGTTSSAVAVLYDPKTGRMLSKHRYGAGSQGHMIRFPKAPLADHGTGGNTTAGGCGRVTVTNKLHSTLGFTLGVWKVWTDWCWTRSNQVVSVNDKGVAQDTDLVWSYDGVLPEFNENHYYDFSVNNGYPKSAYMFVRVAHFHGPTVFAGHDSTWTPKNSLASYYNGTWQWWTSS